MRIYLLLLAVCGISSAQTIEGFVEDSLTRQPISGAHVAFGGATVNDRYMTFSDRTGHFIRALPPAAGYTVVVSRNGYLTPEQALTVAPAENSAPLRIQLTPQALIAGKLVDDDGFPVEGARVEALRSELVEGRPQLKRAAPPVVSDDLGEFRLAGLPEGHYLIRATPSPRATWDRRYVTQYYPGSLEPLAADAIQISTGQKRTGIAFPFHKFEGVTIAGHVELPRGTKIPRAILPIFLLSTDGTGFVAGSTFWKTDQLTFVFRHVPAGNYIVKTSTGPVAVSLNAEQELDVAGADVSDVVVPLRASDPLNK
ncbi:MAG: carboxypeptidase-like regulatory domain-containing protein [Bryobacteraceae bacterium]|nr:carboxypeptidase-like regulatory domain-containing protein [Bryobacteraceae bacterium]